MSEGGIWDRVLDLENKVEQLETIIEKLELRIFQLENPGPFVPDEQEPHDWLANKCPTCNIEFKGAMGYVCNRTDCPYGMSVSSTSFEPINRGG